MRNPGKNPKQLKPCRRVVALTIRGSIDPEVYTVGDDVYLIVRKLLDLNRLATQCPGAELIDFEEVRFLLRILGVDVPNRGTRPHLWITED